VGERRYIAIDGPPGSGASALARAVAARGGAVLHADPAPSSPFKAEFADHPERFAFQTQTYCLLARYRQQLELAQPDLFATGGAVTDYWFAKDRLYARVVLTRDELALYERIHALLAGRLPEPSLVVYVTADTDVLRRRIRGLVPSADRVIKLNVIDQLAAEMDHYAFGYDQGPLLAINTSELDAVETPAHLEELTEHILSTRAGVHHIRPLSRA
jgi:deoxyadenosine/deoxycytidine kinase